VATPTNLSNIYSAGLNNVGSYQVSGVPFCSGAIDVNSYGASGVKIEFPYVTSWVEIINVDTGGEALYVGFSQAGVQGSNRFTIQQFNTGFGAPISDPLPIKVTEIWLSGACDSADIVAGLTYLPVQQVTNVSPSGPNWSGSVGVG